ncbi:hypothetical protein L1I30_08285 [Gillisia sp. M10.2A]|uniref:DUF2490 domain-containing protein n=1 Tax=Gillisia lutea TaxID=2909668 RepID=A0ABS9EFK1_9FLAO|nr:hypothetical protein [Gillisia lutea]MCF4101659.1 hypothetical protein [Gillisia lutea]
MRTRLPELNLINIIINTSPKSKLYFNILAVLLLSLGCLNTNAQEVPLKHKNSGFIDFNAYRDSRDFNVFTINLFASLPHRLQYFSLTNYFGEPDTAELSKFYAEHNLRWAINEKIPIDLTYQYVLRQGETNDDHRFGLRWRLHDTPFLQSIFSTLNLSYTFNPMFFQYRKNTSPEYMSIIEHVYNLKIFPQKLGNRLYIAGFADQNFNYKENDKVAFEWVSEHQIGLRLIDQLYAVAEYRINTFVPSNNYGWGYGLEYKMIF